MTNRRLLACLWLLATLCVVGQAAAQANRTGPDSTDAHLRNDCRLAYQVLVHGQPANKYHWALGVITSCGARGGDALAAVLARHTQEQAPHGPFDRVVEAAALLQDQRVLNAALALASDASASDISRVQAIRIVYHQLHPGTFQRFDAFVVDPVETQTLIVPLTSSEAPPVGTPLGAGAHEQVQRVLSEMLDGSALPPAVRTAAAYLLGSVDLALARQRLCDAGVPEDECRRRLDEWEAQAEERIP